MVYLLSHGRQSTKSRHKVSKAVDNVLNDVESWIGRDINWCVAKATVIAMPEAERSRLGSKLGRKRPAHLHARAADLLPLVEILAALIILHPDPELEVRNKILLSSQSLREWWPA
jgi:hypothetical protein